MTAATPVVHVFAGPNGAGKSSTAAVILPALLPPERFVNPDAIARDLSPLTPAAVAQRAGRHALLAIRDFTRQRVDFAFETTLSGRWTTQEFTTLLAAGYHVHLYYFWLPSAEFSLARVHARARAGGHVIPDMDVRRRFARSLANFQTVGRQLATVWYVNDGREPIGAPVVARGIPNHIEVLDPLRWAQVERTIQEALRRRR